MLERSWRKEKPVGISVSAALSRKQRGVSSKLTITVWLGNPYGFKGEETNMLRRQSTAIFIAVFFLIAQIWSQAKCPPTGRESGVHVYTQWNTSAIEKNLEQRDEPGGHYVKCNKPGTKRQSPHAITYMWNL